MTVAGLSDGNAQPAFWGLKIRRVFQAQLQTSGCIQLVLRQGFRQQA